jgi:hypothetical protein
MPVAVREPRAARPAHNAMEVHMSEFLLAVSGFVLAMSIPAFLVTVAEGTAASGHSRFARCKTRDPSALSQPAS